MEKSAQSDTENSVWFTELTEAEMESITGGAITTTDLDGWLAAYQNGTLQPLSVAAKLQRSYRTGDGVNDAATIALWFATLSRDDKKDVIGAVASSIVEFAKLYFHLS